VDYGCSRGLVQSDSLLGFRNRQVIGSSPIVGSMFSITYRSVHRNLLHIYRTNISIPDRFIASVTMLGTILM
jgi:hypothetical protein